MKQQINTNLIPTINNTKTITNIISNVITLMNEKPDDVILSVMDGTINIHLAGDTCGTTLRVLVEELDHGGFLD